MIGKEAWWDIVGLWVTTHDDREVVLALLRALRPNLVHYTDRNPLGARVEQPHGRSAIATDCHRTCWMIAEALDRLGIGSDFIKVGGHSGLVFRSLGVGTFDGDDLYHSYDGVRDLAQIERLLLPEEDLIAWGRVMTEEPRRIRDEVEPKLRDDQVSDQRLRAREEARAALTDSPVTLEARTCSGDLVTLDQVTWVDVTGLEVLDAVPLATIERQGAGRTALRIRGLGGDLGNLGRVPSWLLAGSDRVPATQQVLEHVLPNGRLPSDRDGAIALAAELVFEEALTAIAAEIFLKQNVHPAYRESGP